MKVPALNCTLCPRLLDFREKNNEEWPDWHNAPVNSFGSLNSRLLILGLAPGLRGANKTGRPFTGDFAGDLLYRTLNEFNLSSVETSVSIMGDISYFLYVLNNLLMKLLAESTDSRKYCEQ